MNHLRDGTQSDLLAHAPTIGFVLEQTLGHITHSANLRAIISTEPTVRAQWRPIDWDVDGLAARLPGFRDNWTVRAGLRARRAITDMHAATPLDALFIHTQVPAVLASSWLARIPTVVSVDATPLQYDELGDFYGHQQSSSGVEKLKLWTNRKTFQQAARLVSWSHWAKAGLVDGYDVPAEKVTVIPPGVDAAGWAAETTDRSTDGPVRILFVGGDLERKGGTLLLEAFRILRTESPMTEVELHLVTQAPVQPQPGVTVHHGLTPNSAPLKALYHHSDIFCLPTQGDCLPMVLSEAGAAGLPLVSTDVGAIREIVRDGDTGFLVPQNDVASLVTVLRELVGSPELRQRQGNAAATLVGRQFDAVKNARHLLDVLLEVAESPRPVEKRRGPAFSLASGSFRPPERADRREVLLTVSGVIPADVRKQVNDGVRPRPDYLVMAEAFNADLVDYVAARRMAGRQGRLVERIAGPSILLAWACFKARRRYRVVFTDGEQVGLPCALLCRLARRDRPRHHMIAHIMSVPKKVLLYRVFGLHKAIDTIYVYAQAQKDYIERTLGFPGEDVVLTPFMVDSRFFSSAPSAPRRMICSAGLERRDYRTLIEAVRGLDAGVVVAAASPWSKRGHTLQGQLLPDNVEVCQLGFVDLRRLYAECLFVVMPLEDVPFQAGVTTILEAMAMGKAVICSRTVGQTDIVVDGETGLYVEPGNVTQLREVIQTLLNDPTRAERMGAAGRRKVEEQMDVTHYADRLSRFVRKTADLDPVES